jgi:hypothetical protein
MFATRSLARLWMRSSSLRRATALTFDWKELDPVRLQMFAAATIWPWPELHPPLPAVADYLPRQPKMPARILAPGRLPPAARFVEG